jgi:hypothetical protein
VEQLGLIDLHCFEVDNFAEYSIDLCYRQIDEILPAISCNKHFSFENSRRRERTVLMKKFAGLFLLLAMPILAQNPAASSHSEDTFKSLRFLEGSWTATTRSNGAAASGSYSFNLELGEHVLARHSHTDAACKGPATFDCEHGDLLYVFADAPG